MEFKSELLGISKPDRSNVFDRLYLDVDDLSVILSVKGLGSRLVDGFLYSKTCRDIDGILVKYVESDCLDEIEKMLADVDEQERLIWNRTIAELD